MHGVAQHDEERVGGRVEHQTGAGEAGVARRARGGHRAHVPVLVELEAQPVLVPGEGGVEVGEHQLHRLRREDPPPAVHAAVEQRTAEDRQVPRVREHPGVPRDAAEAERVLVVHLAPHQPPVEAGPRPAGVLRGRDPRLPGGGRVVTGAAHAQRAGDPLVQEDVQRAAGDPLQDQLQRDQVQVRVAVRGPGRIDRRLVEEEPDPLLVRGRLVQRDPGAEPRGVGEQLADRHVLLARAGEVRQIRRDGRLQLQPAPLDLLHGEDGGEQLRHRGQVEDGVRAHGELPVRRELDAGVGLLVVGPVAHRHADGAVQRHRVAASGQQHGPRVPGVGGRRTEERLGVGDELTQRRGEQPGAPGGAVPQGPGTAVRRTGGRGGGGRKGGEGQRPAQRHRASAELTPGDAARPCLRHEVLPCRDPARGAERIFRGTSRGVKLSCQVRDVSMGRARPGGRPPRLTTPGAVLWVKWCGGVRRGGSEGSGTTERAAAGRAGGRGDRGAGP